MVDLHAGVIIFQQTPFSLFFLFFLSFGCQICLVDTYLKVCLKLGHSHYFLPSHKTLSKSPWQVLWVTHLNEISAKLCQMESCPYGEVQVSYFPP